MLARRARGLANECLLKRQKSLNVFLTGATDSTKYFLLILWV